MKKIKVSELPLCKSLKGLFTLGTDANNRSVKVSLEFVEEVASDVVTAQTTAEAAKEVTDTKGLPGGLASLDGNGKVPASQLPDVDDVLEFGGVSENLNVFNSGAPHYSSDTGCEVVYDATGQRFALAVRKSPLVVEHYSAWLDDSLYMDGGRPRRGKLYIDTTDNILWRFNGEELVKVCTAAETGPAGAKKTPWHIANGRRWGEYAYGMMPLNPHPGVVYKACKQYIDPKSAALVHVKAVCTRLDPGTVYAVIPGWMRSPAETHCTAFFRKSPRDKYTEVPSSLEDGVLRIGINAEETEGMKRIRVIIGVLNPFEETTYVTINRKGELAAVPKENVLFPAKSVSAFPDIDHLNDVGDCVKLLKGCTVEQYARRLNWSRNSLGKALYKVMYRWRDIGDTEEFKLASTKPTLLRVRGSKKREWAYLHVGTFNSRVRRSANGHVKERRVVFLREFNHIRGRGALKTGK